MNKILFHKKILTNIFRQAKNISPTLAEKDAVLKNVAKHIEKNPLPEIINENNPLISSFISPYGYLIKERFSLVFLMLLIIFGATSVLANSSLPGDLLYPIKTNVNEKITSLSAFNPEVNAVIQIEYATRRLTEARVLAVTGKIDENTEEVLAKSFNDHTKRVQGLITIMEKKGKEVEAQIIKDELNVRLKAHQEILAEILIKKNDKEQKKLDKINNVVNDFLKNNDNRPNIKAENKTKTDIEPSVDTDLKVDTESKIDNNL